MQTSFRHCTRSRNPFAQAPNLVPDPAAAHTPERAPSAPTRPSPTLAEPLALPFPHAHHSPAPPFLFERRLCHTLDLIPTHHRPKVVPPRQHHLHDMNQEEPNKSHRQPEVLPPCHLISTQQRRQPMRLRRL